MASFTSGSKFGEDDDDDLVTLSLPGPREVIDADRCAVLLSSFLAAAPPLDSVSVLRLGDKSYTKEGCLAMCDLLLKKCKQVKTLDLADVIAGRMEAEGLEVLKAFSNCAASHLTGLKGVDLSDNAMGLKGISSCKPLFDAFLPTLESLRMCNDGLSHQSMEEVADILCPEGGKAAQMKCLHFFNNMSGDPGCEQWKRIIDGQATPGLMKDLRFSGTRAGSDGSLFIALALEGKVSVFGDSLAKLDLADNTFSGTGGCVLASAFEKGFGRNLASLNLRDCSMGDENACRLLASLGRSLTSLDVSGNELTTEGCATLGDAASRNAGLVRLMADENDEMGSEGALALFKGLGEGLGSLEEVGLASCEIKGAGARALISLIEGGKLPAIRKVGLDGNMFSATWVERLEGALGERLTEMEDNISDEEDDCEDEEQEGGGDGGIDDLVEGVAKASI